MTAPADPSNPGSRLPAPPGAARGRRRWWLLGAVAGWAVLIVVLAVSSVRHDPPTVPDQRDLADAVPAVDRATAAVLAATAGDAVVEFGPLVVTRDCRITPVRDGAEATRDVVVHVRRGDGPATLRALAAALPAGFQAEVGHGAAGAQQILRADAGDFVAVRGTAADAGDVVNLRASSGCRPTAGVEVVDLLPAVSPPPALVAALGALNRPAAEDALSAWELRCPAGDVARTTAVTDAGPAPADLDRALDRITGDATVVQDDPDAFAYREGEESIVATAVGGRLRVTASTAC